MNALYLHLMRPFLKSIRKIHTNSTLFDEIISMYDLNNELNDYTKHMSARQLYMYRIKHKPTWFTGNVNIYDVYKTIYERDAAKEKKGQGYNITDKE